MKNTLIISGHSDLNESVINKLILDELEQTLPQAEIRRIDQLHQNFEFDVPAEQAALLNADVIVWQFPFYWYATPAVLKKWIDDVFLFGFSHGDVRQLAGKKLILSITLGAPRDFYKTGGLAKHEVAEFLKPFEALCSACEIDLQAPVLTYAMSYGLRSSPEAVEEQKRHALDHAKRLVEQINAL